MMTEDARNPYRGTRVSDLSHLMHCSLGLQKGKRKQLSGALADLSSLSGALLDAASSDAAKAEQKANPKGLGVGGAKKRMRIK